nr:sodium channel protein Nach-like isoform X1 [Osmia lignaria]
MSRRFGNKNEEFFYFNTNRNGKIPKRLTSKTINVNAKSVAEKSPEMEKKILTPQDVINDFLESTSVHGLQYFAKIDIRVGILGKILWTCAMLTGFVCRRGSLFITDRVELRRVISICFVSGLSLMVVQFLTRYRENPTNTYIKTFTAPIFDVPFPAVTVCPLTPVSLRKQLKILDSAILPENMSKELAMEFLKRGRQITLPYMAKTFEHSDKFQSFLEANKWSVLDFLKVLYPCDEIFESCRWNSERTDCDKIIKYAQSSYGLCCSFNYVLEKYVGRDKTQPKIIPQSSVGFGPWSGLKLVIRKEILSSALEDKNGTVNLSNDGVGLLIHHSMEYPGLNTNLYVLQPGHNLEVAIQPTMIKKPAGMYHRTMEGKLVPVCIPNEENNLEYLPVYRYSNCYANCRIKAMLNICGCLPYTYDYLTFHHKVNQCDTNGLICIQENMKFIAIVKDSENQNFSCFCRTSCNNVDYESFPNIISQIHTGDSPFNNGSVRNAVLTVFMDLQSHLVLETLPAADEIYLLASIGGIFSLFLGCSFLSLVEIIYFAGLLCRAIFLNRKAKIASQREQTTRDNFIKRRTY